MTSSCPAGLSCSPAARRGKCRRFTVGRAVSALVSGTGAWSVTCASASRYPAVDAEAPNFPANSKATGFWFPRNERALATAIFDAGAQFANVIGVPATTLIGQHTSWRVVFAIVGDVIPPRERGRYQGYFGAVFGVSSVVGPLAGGFAVDSLSWRYIFYVNLPLGIAALGVTNRVLRLPMRKREVKIDWWGALLLVIGVSCIL